MRSVEANAIFHCIRMSSSMAIKSLWLVFCYCGALTFRVCVSRNERRVAIAFGVVEGLWHRRGGAPSCSAVALCC